MSEKRRPAAPNDLEAKFREHVRAAKAHQRRITSRAARRKTGLRTEFEKREQRDAHDYDGIRGQLPDWAPAPLRDEFNTVRNRLLDLLESESIGLRNAHRWMDTVRSLLSQKKKKFSWTEYVPPECEQDIIRLVQIQDIVNRGPQGGITAYLGKDARKLVDEMAFRERQSKAAKQPRPTSSMRAIDAALNDVPEGAPASEVIKKLPPEQQPMSPSALGALEKGISRGRKRHRHNSK